MDKEVVSEEAEIEQYRRYLYDIQCDYYQDVTEAQHKLAAANEKYKRDKEALDKKYPKAANLLKVQ